MVWKEDESLYFVLGNNYINEIVKLKFLDVKVVYSFFLYLVLFVRGCVNEIWEWI